jgi:hypothetical protein
MRVRLDRLPGVGTRRLHRGQNGALLEGRPSLEAAVGKISCSLKLETGGQAYPVLAMLSYRVMDKPPRVVGRRPPPRPGELPNKAAREAMEQMAQYHTRAPKGVFHYRSHEEANRDRDRWLTEAMVLRQASR